MKKLSLAIATLLALTVLLMAQSAGEVGAPDPTTMGKETSTMKIEEISIDKFENAGFWLSNISSDDGVSTTKLLVGTPAGKKQLESEKALGMDPKETDKYVLGTRVDFYRRGFHEIMVYPQKPLPVAGVTKTVSLWVVGRNYNHTLKLVVKDFFGNEFELTMGKLNFQGWKQLTVTIPPQDLGGGGGIVQRDFHYNSRMGLRIFGFKIETDPMESYGSLYIYLDDLRAFTDLYAEETRDTDDMSDSW